MSVFSTDFQQSQNIWHVCAVWTYHTFSFFDASSLYFEDQRTIFGKYLCILEPSFEKKIIWPFRKFYPVFRKQSQISQLIFNSLRTSVICVPSGHAILFGSVTPSVFVLKANGLFYKNICAFGPLIWKQKHLCNHSENFAP